MIFGSLGLLVVAGGLLAAGISKSSTGFLVVSLICTAGAGVLLFLAYAAARSGAGLGALGAGTPAPAGFPGQVPAGQPVVMYVPVTPGTGGVPAAPTGLPATAAQAFAPTNGGSHPQPTTGPPIVGYDQMTAEQILKLIGTGALTDDQLRAMRDYEANGPARKTVLSRLENV